MTYVRSANGAGSSLTRERLLADILNECLEAMEQGEHDLDRLTDRYPDARNEIRPLLETGQMLLNCSALSQPPETPYRPGARPSRRSSAETRAAATVHRPALTARP
ncbi:MAG: hypothetical protein V3S00_05640 [Dehalococcoidia bacterium]